jgi:hypothetical protein
MYYMRHAVTGPEIHRFIIACYSSVVGMVIPPYDCVITIEDEVSGVKSLCYSRPIHSLLRLGVFTFLRLLYQPMLCYRALALLCLP